MKPTQFFFFNLRFSYSELFKAKTLEFFSKTLPILKADDTLPKVARYEDNHISQNPTLFHSKPGSRITFYHHRTKRSVAEESEEVVPKEEVVLYVHLYHSINTGCLRWISHIFLILLYFTFFSSKSETDPDTTKRQGRGFCNDSYGVFCMLYNALSGKAGDKAADR